jgi:hypothetical protein
MGCNQSKTLDDAIAGQKAKYAPPGAETDAPLHGYTEHLCDESPEVAAQRAEKKRLRKERNKKLGALQVEKAAAAAEGVEEPFEPGDAVSCLWPPDGKWYNATLGPNDGGWKVHWETNEWTFGVTEDLLKHRAVEGDEVQDEPVPPLLEKGTSLVMKPKQGTDNYGNCGGLYTHSNDSANGQPIYHNADTGRYLSYCGYMWVLGRSTDKAKEGRASGYHFSDAQGIEDVLGNTFEKYDLISDPTDVEAFIEDSKRLFKGEPPCEPNDINQGPLGDCWLMGSIAALAEKSERVQQLFVTDTPDADGNYTVRLFDVQPSVKDWVEIQSHANTSPYAHSKSGEKWLVVLERAFAIKFGDFKKLSGNNGGLAMMMLTGGGVESFSLKPDGWKKSTSKPGDDFDYDGGYRNFYNYSYSSTPRLTDGEMWAKLVESNAKDCVMTCSRSGHDSISETGKAKGDYGMVDGHLYSLIEVIELRYGELRLINCRNPWGKTEWGGDWSDQSGLWAENPDVAEACKFEAKQDGSFWMTFEDFKGEFSSMSICTVPE